MGPLLLWQWLVLFLVAGVFVVLAGTKLARAGDEIATRTGLGGLLVGMLMLSVATSLPELAVGVSASLGGAPDLAVGDLFGSSMANMAILAILDVAHRGRVWPAVGGGHARLAAVAIGLTSFAVLAVLAPSGLTIGWVGVETIGIVVAYIAAAVWMGRSRGEERGTAAPAGELLEPTGWAHQAEAAHSLRYEFAVFGAATLVILVAAPVLALSAKGIADETGIGQTFIGVLLLAVTTSLPELVASLAAVRIGAHDMAVGNVFGSNAVNMMILFADDVAYRPGPILAAVAPAQVVAGVGAILLMAIALAALAHGKPTRFRRLEPHALMVLVVYVLLLGAVWQAST